MPSVPSHTAPSPTSPKLTDTSPRPGPRFVSVAAAATLTNLGPGLGDVAVSFGGVGDGAVWLGTLGMILGRLEVFSLLVLFTPHFWRE